MKTQAQSRLVQLGRTGITIIAVTAVAATLLLPLFKQGVERVMGVAPLMEIHIGDDPGQVSFTPASNPEGMSR